MRKAILLLLATALGAGCGSDDRPASTGRKAGPAPGVVLVTLEHWWSPGDPDEPFAGPELEEFVRFPDAMTPCPQSRPAMASLLTGTGPDRLGVVDDLGEPLGSDVPVLPELLAAQGWSTAAFVSNPDLGRHSGLDRGFRLFDAPGRYLAFGPTRFYPPVRPPEAVVSNFLQWSESRPPEEEFFAWLHLSGLTHAPPAEKGTPEGSQRSVSTVGEQVARLIGELREREASNRTAVIIVGLAGRLNGDDAARAGYFLTPEILKVPLLYRPAEDLELPIDPAAGSIWLPELASAILEAARAGASMGEESGRAGNEAGVRYAWTWRGATEMGWPPERAVVSGDRMLVTDAGGNEMRTFAWSTGEPLSSPEPELIAALEARPLPEFEPSSPVREFPEELREEIAWAEIVLPEPPGARPSSAHSDRLASLEQVIVGRRAVLAEKLVEAGDAFVQAGRADPGNVGAFIAAGEVSAMLGQGKWVRRRINKALALDPYRPDAWHALGHGAHASGRYRRAEIFWRTSDLLRAGQPDVLYDLTCARALLGKIDEALADLRRAWDAGYREVNHIQADPDLRDLRADPGYERFMHEVVR